MYLALMQLHSESQESFLKMTFLKLVDFLPRNQLLFGEGVHSCTQECSCIKQNTYISVIIDMKEHYVFFNNIADNLCYLIPYAEKLSFFLERIVNNLKNQPDVL